MFIDFFCNTMSGISKKTTTQELIIQVRSSDHSAFETLYNNYFPRVMGLLTTLHLTYYAEDVIQETFIIIWNRRHTLDPNKSFDSYIFTIAKNLALKTLKKNIKDLLDAGEIEEKKILVAEIDPFLKETEQISTTILNSLPERPKAVFTMKRLQGWSTEQIAKHLKIAPKTVENHMNRALILLKENIKYLSLFFYFIYSK